MSFDEQIRQTLGGTEAADEISCDHFTLEELQGMTGIHRSRLGRMRGGKLKMTEDEARRVLAAALKLSNG